MPDLSQRHQLLLRARILLSHLAFEKAQIIIVSRDRLEVLIPHDLGRDVGIIGIEQRERLPATKPIKSRWSGARRTWPEYFSVASWYGGGHMTRLGATIFICIPRETAMKVPGRTLARGLAPRSWR